MTADETGERDLLRAALAAFRNYADACENLLRAQHEASAWDWLLKRNGAREEALSALAALNKWEAAHATPA